MSNVSSSVVGGSLLALFALAACTTGDRSAPVAPAAFSADASFAQCDEVSVAFDVHAEREVIVADFLDRARLSGCPYGRMQIATAPGVWWDKSWAYGTTRTFAQQYARTFELPWAMQNEFRDPRLPMERVRLTLFRPNADDVARAETHADVAAAAVDAQVARARPQLATTRSLPDRPGDPPLRRANVGPLTAPPGLFSAAVAEVCFGAALANRSAHDVAGEARYEPSGWVGERYGQGHAEDAGWFVLTGKRVYLLTRPGEPVCAVNARDGDPMELASYALAALDALSLPPYPGACPGMYECRALPDGRIMILGLRLAGNDAPERYRATRGENVGAARALAGAVTPGELAALVENIAEGDATLPTRPNDGR